MDQIIFFIILNQIIFFVILNQIIFFVILNQIIFFVILNQTIFFIIFFRHFLNLLNKFKPNKDKPCDICGRTGKAHSNIIPLTPYGPNSFFHPFSEHNLR